MIVNSYPYNPSQQQQQRCVGLNQSQNQNHQNKQNTTSSNHQEASMNRLLNLSSVSQQNSLYGSSFDHNHHPNHHHHHQTSAATNQTATNIIAPISHDLANLQFDSPPTINNPIDSITSQSMGGQDLLSASRNKLQRAAPAANQTQTTASDNSQATATTTATNNDMSLYSPSSSTSLLYHIYDQINLPNDPYHHQSNATTADANNNGKFLATTLNGKKNNNTTILNPANLLSQQQQRLPLQVQMHQHQLSQLAEMQKQQQQQCYSTYQQHPFSTLNPHHSHLNHQLPAAAATYMTATAQQQTQNNLMLDTAMRHQRLQRPLSSSAASSMSGQSIPAYGRHARQSFMGASNGIVGHETLGAFNTTKSQNNNLANVLHANNTLGHNHQLIFGSTVNSSLQNNNTTKSHHHLHHQHQQQQQTSSKMGPTGCCCWLFNCNHSSKQMNQRARSLLYEYRTVVKCSLLLIILAFALMSVIKFTSLSASSTSSSSISSSASSSQPPFNNIMNPSISSNIFYPPPFHHNNNNNNNNNQKPDLSGVLNGGNPSLIDPSTDEPQSREQDSLKSRLLTGEFVILTQNFSHVPSQRTTLAERIVKLMDQVFLASPDVKQLYSRMEVISIRPNQAGGILVNCNIILNESIAYAAQQFGLAFYNSLSNSRELLAGHAGYQIDKNSIKLNSVPDKDLKSGLVPPALIPPSLIHEFAPSQQQPVGILAPATRAPPSAETIDLPDIHQQSQDNLEQQPLANQVVWSEWSDWSSCVDKNGVCDSARLHSRLRRCVAQHTGDKVDALNCKQRYSMQDQELEVSDCSRTCSASVEAQHIMSDAPSQLGPHTASPFLVDSGPFNSAMISAIKPLASKASSESSLSKDNLDESTTSVASVMSQQQQQQQQQSQASIEQQKPSSSSSEQQQQQPTIMNQNNNDISSSSSSTPTLMPPMITLQQQQQQASNEISCSNCTSGEICLLLIKQKVPFCAKVKDRSDACGGWCQDQNQLCQPIGSSAFKCIHDSECLAEEWRCHDSQCIPLSNHCDGHSNCYDNSDERDCPIKK